MKKIVGQVSVFCLLSLLAGSGAVSAQSTDATLSGLTVSDASLAAPLWLTRPPTQTQTEPWGDSRLAAASVGIPAALLDQVETPLPAGALEIPAPGSLHSGHGIRLGVRRRRGASRLTARRIRLPAWNGPTRQVRAERRLWPGGELESVGAMGA